MPSESTGASPVQIHTVHSFAESEPAFTEGGIRWTVFRNRERLLERGAIFYNGRKLLIDRDRFIEFIRGGHAI